MAPRRLRSRWSTWAFEVLVITFGILLAFLIDAWWDERRDRTRERDYIVKLTEEFEASRAERASGPRPAVQSDPAR